MPRNVAGVYSLPAVINPVVTGTTVATTWANPTLNDIANALTDSVDRRGRTSILANLPMSGFKHTGAAPATLSGDYLTWGQAGAQLQSLNVKGAVGGTPVQQLSFEYHSSPSKFLAIGLDPATANARILAGAGAALNFHTDSDLVSSNVRMTLRADGKLGIGIDPPAAKLDVNGGTEPITARLRSSLEAGQSVLETFNNSAGVPQFFAAHSGADVWLGNARGSNSVVIRVNSSSVGQFDSYGMRQVLNPCVSAADGGTQTRNSVTWTVLNGFTVEAVDVGNCWNGADTFTAPIPGLYEFRWNATLQGNGSTGIAQARWYKNGAAITSVAMSEAYTDGTSFFRTMTCGGVIDLGIGDTLQVFARRSAGAVDLYLTNGNIVIRRVQ